MIVKVACPLDSSIQLYLVEVQRYLIWTIRILAPVIIQPPDKHLLVVCHTVSEDAKCKCANAKMLRNGGKEREGSLLHPVMRLLITILVLIFAVHCTHGRSQYDRHQPMGGKRRGKQKEVFPQSLCHHSILEASLHLRLSHNN
jgi:hypothetical protein